MPSVTATIEYLQKLPLYENEKPYWCFLPPHDGFDPDKQRVDNLEWEDHSNIRIQDIRESIDSFQIDDCGFQVLNHNTAFSKFDAPSDVVNYKSETEELLRQMMNAVFVRCYDSRLRKNVPFQRTQLDLNDPLLTEGPARGVHNGKLLRLYCALSLVDVLDITIDSGPVVINRYLTEEDKAKFLKPGYRVRIVK